jgi:hypothetical protein
MKVPRVNARSAAIEAAIVASLGFALSGVSVGLMVYGSQGEIRFSVSDLVIAYAAGVTVAMVIRVTLVLHRRWARTVGRYTAGAALCAIAAIVGVLVVLIPADCPGGGPFATGRCDAREATSWGLVAGLASIVNLGTVGVALAATRFVRGVAVDGSAQAVITAKALRKMWRRRVTDRLSSDKAARREGAKGRPTPRRADARRDRAKRLRGRV